MQPLVSICCPTLGRPEKLARLLRLIEAHAGWPHEVIVRWDELGPENRGCPTVLAECVAASRGEYVCFLGNDCAPEPNFLRYAMEAMAKWFPDGVGLVAMNDGYWQGELATHWVASKKLLDCLDGYFFWPGYHHACCDSELTERCRLLNKYVWCAEARVGHDHPIHQGMQGLDKVYQHAYNPVRRQEDCDLLLERAKRIGFPIRQNFSRPRIPRKLWRVWLGGDRKPALVEGCLESQEKYSLGWEVHLITDENRPRGIPYVEDAVRAKKWVKAVDYLKLHLLWLHGGVYMDADVELLKSLPDEMRTHSLFAGVERNGWIGNGVIGAEPGHPILQACLDRVVRDFRGDDDKNFESSVQVFTETIYGTPKREGVAIYSPDVFTPYDHQAKRTELTQDTVAFHHYLVSWGYPQVGAAIDLRLRLQPYGDISKLKVLNIGIGSGQSGLAIQLPALRFGRLDNVEIYLPYIEAAKRRFWVSREVNFFLDDACNLPESDLHFYDLVLAFDVLEHLEKQAALDLIARCPDNMLVFIPLEDQPRCHREGADDIPSQDHLSTWTQQEFIDLGFETELLPGFHREGEENWPALWAWRKERHV